MNLPITVALGVLLLALSVVDVKQRRLPDWGTLPFALSGVAASLVGLTDVDLASSLAGAGVGFSVIWLANRAYRALRETDGIGMGDAKLFAGIGAWMGPLWLAPIMLIATLGALFTVLVAYLLGRRQGQEALPFGPFLCVSFLLCWCTQAFAGVSLVGLFV